MSKTMTEEMIHRGGRVTAKFVGELPGPGPWTMTRYGSGRDAVIVLTSPTAPAMMLVDDLLVSMDLSGVESTE